MNYSHFKKHFANDRIYRYEQATGNNPSKTIALYKANIAISQSFIPLISILEVALRNNIDEALGKEFNDNQWIRTQKKGFMNAPFLRWTDPNTGKLVDDRYHLKKVEAAEKDIIGNGLIITTGRIVSMQTFGFWTRLFNKKIYKSIKGSPINAFPNRPLTCDRQVIANSLFQIRNFRNRISHHEPICFNSLGEKDFTEIRRIHKLIKTVLKWIDPKLCPFMNEIDKVNTTIMRMESMYKKAK